LNAARFEHYLPYAGLVDEGVVLCKDGSFLHTFEVEAYDLTFQDGSVTSLYIRNIGDIFRLISESPYIIYTDCISRENYALNGFCDPGSPDPVKVFEAHRKDLLPFFRTRFFISLLLKPPEGRLSLNNFIFGNSDNAEDGAVLKKTLDEFRRAIIEIGNMLKGTFRTVTSLDNDGLVTYLHSTFSGSDHPVKAPEESFFYLDCFLSDGIVRPDVVTTYNDHFIATLSIHLWPSQTAALFMSHITSFPMPFRITTSYEFITREQAKRRIKSDRNTHFKKRRGVGQIAFDSATKTASVLEDTDMLSLTSDASTALSQLSDGYTNFGFLTCTVTVMDRDYAQLKAKVEKIQSFIQNEHFICKTETLNNPLAYLGSIPGNYMLNPKKYTVSTRNLAHFFPLSSPWEGTPCDDHLRDLYKSKYDLDLAVPFLNAYSSYGRRPFNVNLNYKECGHALLVGPTGMGKSVLLNMMALAALKFPYSQVISFDKGASCRNVCLKSGGIYLEINDSPESLKLNPFHDLDGADKLSQTSNLLISYLKAKGVRLLPPDEQKIYDALENLATLPGENRGFETFARAVQNDDIRGAFQPFIDGEHANLFKNGEDSIRNERWIAFEMEWLMTNKPAEVVEFVLNYLFIVINRFLDGNFKFIPLDEAWVYIKNKTFCAIIEDILRTWRKKHAYAVLTTQNVNDAFNSPIFSTILNACFTKLLTPNPRASKIENVDFYKSLDLSADDIYALENFARPNKDYFFVNPYGKQLFDLHLSAEELALLK
jgi:type IV secretion system protein VirB4